METQWIHYLIGALIVAGLGFWFWRQRQNRLSLRIEAVPADRIDNTPVDRNEIIGSVRVRARQQDASRSDDVNTSVAAESAKPRIEPTVDAPVPAQPVFKADEAPIEPPAMSPAEPVAEPDDMPVAEQAVALTQEDLFAADETKQDEPSFDGIDDTELAFDRVLSIHVMAREGLMPGRALLEHMLQYGLRYGDMSIFHRHEHPTGQGTILFSLAQAMEPGTFDLDTLARDNVPGVSLFMGLPGFKSVMAYDLMIDTARRLASALNADMLDDRGQILSAGKLADWRDEVVAYDNRQTH